MTDLTTTIIPRVRGWEDSRRCTSAAWTDHPARARVGNMRSNA